jgi:hypothetical protein
VPADPFRSALQSLADLGEPDGDEAVWLPSLVQGALQALPRFDHASITIRRNGNPLDTIATTDDIAVQGDRLQGELREGPCHDAATDADYKFSRVLRDDPTWPRYGPKVAELGMVSQLALHLNMRRGPRASLNLYADRLVEIDDPVLEMAGLYAASMSNILGLVRTVDNLRTALGTNRTIGQAIGIVMERHQVSQERAFAYLSRLSQDSNIKPDRSNRRLARLASALVRRCWDDAVPLRGRGSITSMESVGPHRRVRFPPSPVVTDGFRVSRRPPQPSRRRTGTGRRPVLSGSPWMRRTPPGPHLVGRRCCLGQR